MTTIPVTDAQGKVTYAEGRVGSYDEQAYLTVMIEGVKHFFALDAAVVLTTAFTHVPPGAAERRALAKSASRSYNAYRPPPSCAPLGCVAVAMRPPAPIPARAVMRACWCWEMRQASSPSFGSYQSCKWWTRRVAAASLTPSLMRRAAPARSAAATRAAAAHGA